jgi:hypothetical protein
MAVSIETPLAILTLSRFVAIELPAMEPGRGAQATLLELRSLLAAPCTSGKLRDLFVYRKRDVHRASP